MSFSLISNWEMSFGSTNESVAWSSMMTSPSIEELVAGSVKVIGQALLNDALDIEAAKANAR